MLYFFAVSSSSEKKNDAKVWILDPFELNNFTFNKIINGDKNCKIIPSISENYKRKNIFNKQNQLRISEITRRYLQMDFYDDNKETEKSYFPLAIYPPFIDKRIQSQNSCFTIFGNEITGLANSQNAEWLKEMVIDSESKSKIIKELELIGVNENTISPDLEGLSKSIKNRFSNKYYDNSELLLHIFQDG